MPPKLEKLKELMNIVNEGLSRKDFEESFKSLISFVKEIKSKNKEELDYIKQLTNDSLSHLEQKTDSDSVKAKDEVMKKIENFMNKMYLEHEAMMSMCEKKMEEVRDGEDGKDADEEVIVEQVLALIPEETSVTLRDKLESIDDEDEKLDMKAIKGLLEELQKLRKIKGGMLVAGSSGGGKIVKIYDLSSQLNGVLTTFSLPSFWRVIDVKLTSIPVLRPTTDYTVDGTLKTISFTSQVDTATQLSAGQSLLVIYSE